MNLFVKSIRPSFLILSAFVPCLCSVTTMSFSANDSSRTPIQNTKWSSPAITVGHTHNNKPPAPIYYNNSSAIFSTGKSNSLIKLRRLSSEHRNSQRNIENPQLVAGLQTPSVKEVALTIPSSNFVQPQSFYSQSQENLRHLPSPAPAPYYGTNNQISHFHPDMKSPPIYKHELTTHYEQPTYYSAEYEHVEAEKHEDEPPEIEDKVFSKTIVATKALKIGKIVFTFFLVLVTIILGVLSKLGANLTPVVLPFALFPVGIIALALFIPLFFAFVPLVVAGVAGGKKRRRRRVIDEDRENFLQSLESRVSQIDHWPAFLLSLTLQSYKNFRDNGN